LAALHDEVGAILAAISGKIRQLEPAPSAEMQRIIAGLDQAIDEVAGAVAASPAEAAERSFICR
jgi:hypothetical protein